MNQCLRCSKPCEAAAVFCEACRSFLHSQLWQAANTWPEASIVTPSGVPVLSGGALGGGDPLQRVTGPSRSPRTPPVALASDHKGPPSSPTTPLAPTDILPQTPRPQLPSVPNFSTVADQAMHRLNEAAQRMESHRRLPRASRLSPLRDISAEIQRQSTPLPQAGIEQCGRGEDVELGLPDDWPWLQDGDEHERDDWSGTTDPLLGRHFPNRAETARIEEEDVRRALADGFGVITSPLPPRRVSAVRRRMGLAFVVLAVLAAVFLVVDSVLLSFAFTHPRRSTPVVNGPPALTLSSNVATVGQTVMLYIRHFSAGTHVFLTHDIQEPVQLTAGSALIQVGTNGAADVSMVVDASWGPGFHAIEAEDVLTRYTASATLQIVGAGPTRPSHLLIGVTALDLGADVQGANTIQHLTLHNSGGGSIAWAASSNQSWLLLAPMQGVFSASQTISVAVERANLKPGDYKGTITFSSNVGEAEFVQVHMSVRPLPANVGAVLVVTPPVLSFSALDGGSNPAEQVLVVSNPGSQPLSWSITSNNPVLLASQSLIHFALHTATGWLTTDRLAGVVESHGTSVIQVIVNSRNLLPGVYTDVLVFSGGPGTYDSPQNVSVSLTVQPRCGLTLNAGSMGFTAVSGQGNPSNQSLSFSATSSCAGVIGWKAVSVANWLTVTPASGQLKASAQAVVAVAVNAAILKPGTYVSTISFLAAQSTQTVMVQLVVQSPPSPSEPIMGATPLSLNFSTTQGMPNPPGQVVTITNTGGSQLNWHTTVNTFASSWLGAGPTGGVVAAGQTGQVTITVNIANLTPNTYVGQVVLIGTDAKGTPASGSPQTITVNLLVLPPCTLDKPSLSSIAFSATQGTADPSPQGVSIVATGNCGWPLNWHANITHLPSWLHLAPASGTFVASGQSTSLSIIVSIARLNVGTYTTQVPIVATDGASVQGSPQVIAVTLTVQAPCSLQIGTSNLSFSLVQGQPAPPTQAISFSEIGTCARPVAWTVTGDAGSSGWLTLGPSTTGTDEGNVNVGINPQGLVPGSYTATITVTATGNGGAVVQGSPQTVGVTLTVTGFTLSGTVIACSDSSCTTTKPLPGASLTLVNNTTNKTMTVTADSSGNYSFTNLALGPYMLTVTGSDGTYNYSGSATLTIAGDQTNFAVNTYHS